MKPGRKRFTRKNNTRITVQEAYDLGYLKNEKGKSKYGNKKTEYNGRTYHSKLEANRAIELDLLKRAGQISDWEPQPKFEIAVNGQKICNYYADFKVVYPDNRIEYEDTKGVLTDIYKLKKKLVKALYGVDIIEIYGKRKTKSKNQVQK